MSPKSPEPEPRRPSDRADLDALGPAGAVGAECLRDGGFGSTGHEHVARLELGDQLFRGQGVGLVVREAGDDRQGHRRRQRCRGRGLSGPGAGGAAGAAGTATGRSGDRHGRLRRRGGAGHAPGGRRGASGLGREHGRVASRERDEQHDEDAEPGEAHAGRIPAIRHPPRERCSSNRNVAWSDTVNRPWSVETPKSLSANWMAAVTVIWSPSKTMVEGTSTSRL